MLFMLLFVIATTEDAFAAGSAGFVFLACIAGLFVIWWRGFKDLRRLYKARRH